MAVTCLSCKLTRRCHVPRSLGASATPLTEAMPCIVGLPACCKCIYVHDPKTIQPCWTYRLRGDCVGVQPPHGPDFKQWAKAASKEYPDLAVTTCHQYEIHVPFHYQCLNPE